MWCISGVVFPLGQAMLINMVFLAFFFAVKYAEGSWIGGGWAGMILNIRQMRFIRDWIRFKGNGNPYVLFVSRLVPSIPLGMVSKYYGSMHYDFLYYICLQPAGLCAPALHLYQNRYRAFCNQSVFGAVHCAVDDHCGGSPALPVWPLIYITAVGPAR